MKKIFCFLVSLIAVSFMSFADSKVDEYVLENGMHLFVLEDFSSALVRVEFASKAGFSAQSPDNAGFFPLYTRLFKYASPADTEILSSLEAECNADSSRYYTTVTVSEFDSLMTALSTAAFNPVFQDMHLSRELAAVKKEVSENAFSIEGFINSSIDSRVFAESPWKHDSGIYPKIFAKTTNALARVELASISENFYYPKNCALFVSGPVSKDIVLKTAEYTFGKARISSKKTLQKEVSLEKKETGTKRHFVLSDPEFSPDMTQIVVQYTGLEMEEADYAAQILDMDDSPLKAKLLSNAMLKIRAPEYINAASTHKNGSTRLIIQSLMENPKASPYVSSVQFVDAVKESVDFITQEEFEYAGLRLVNSFKASMSGSCETMKLLSEYWAIQDYKKDAGDIYEENLYSSLLHRPSLLEAQSLSAIKSKLKMEEPFVFVLVNSKLLEKYKKSFSDNGYEIVTAKNGSWYTQELYKSIKSTIENETQKNEEKSEQIDFFFEKNSSSIEKYVLKNNIPLYIKERETSNTVCTALVIKGGELYDAKGDYGLESAACECLSINIQNAVYKRYLSGDIKSIPEVQFEAGLDSCIIKVECVKEELPVILESMADGLIFEELLPSLVDSVVMQRKSNQIVKTSSSVFQLKSAAVSTLIKTKEASVVYSSNKDILKNVSFTKVFEKFTRLLNADRFKIIISGNIGFDENAECKTLIVQLLDETFGILGREGQIAQVPFEINSAPKKIKKVKLVHLFMTDVSRDKAGPRPQVLIPTTEFLDPVQYWIPAQMEDESLCRFNAVLFDFARELEKKCQNVEQSQKMLIRAEKATEKVPFGIITVLNVKSSALIDTLYQETFEQYKTLSDSAHIEKVRSLWIKNQLEETQSNSGLCNLIYEGLESKSENPAKYIEEYSKIMTFSETEMLNISEVFDIDNVIRLYSADTRK